MPETSVPQEKKRSFTTFDTTVSKVDILSPRNKGVRFSLPPNTSLEFKAGQYMQVFIPHEGKARRTSYSIASAPQNKEFFELCVTLVDGGVSSGYIHQLKLGDKVKAMGPLGTFKLKEPAQQDLVFISTGSGIAPLRSMMLDLLNRNTERNIYLIFGNRYDDDILYKTEWEEIAKEHPNFKLLFTLSRPTDAWKGEKGYVQTHIEPFIPDPKTKDFYICGLIKMINDVQDTLLKLGVPKEHINFERYD